MLTFDEIRAAVIMMKRAPLKGEESLIVSQTIMKLEHMAQAMLQKQQQIEQDAKSDDTRDSE